MIKIEKETLLKNTPDYEDYTENVVKVEGEKKSGCGCGKSGGGCCKTRKMK